MKDLNTQPRVEIVILNYKGIHDTLALLENLCQIKYSNFSVILIENASCDRSADKLQEIQHKYLDWRFIYNDKNLGFAGGCNQGIEIALKKNADYILLLNNDTLVENSFLAPLVELSKAHNAISGGLIQYGELEKKKIWSYGGNLTWGAVPGHLHLFDSRVKPESLPENQKTDWILGCCMLIPSNIIRKIGLIDEDYFAYVEDVDYCLRANEAGFPSYVTSKSVIFHKVGQATGGGYSPKGRFLIAESSVVFNRKHADSIKRMKFIILFWIGIFVAGIREGLRGNLVSVKEKIAGYKSGWKKQLNQPRKIR
ncbi:MAG: glycosyltransferase family 2 protein [bacterium]